MFFNIPNRIKKKRVLNDFKRMNKGVRFGENLLLKNPQYIHCGSDTAIGANSNLLCWDEYNGIPFERKPELLIGKRFNATRGLTIQCARKVVIGDNVLIASDVFIIDYNHGMSPLCENYLDNPLLISEGVFIEDGVWIGNNVVILPGVTIGKKSVIGAGAVVTKSIPAYSLALGSPARVVKHYDFETDKWVEENKRNDKDH